MSGRVNRNRTTIVAGWDGSRRASDALELTRVLARATGARVVVAEVEVDRLGALHTPLDRLEADLAEGPVASLATLAPESRAVVSSSAAHGLHDLAAEVGADMIVIGSTHRGPLGRVFLGTVADDLVHASPCAVAIAPRGYDGRYANRLLHVAALAFDASPEAHAAAETAAELALAADAELRVIAVVAEPMNGERSYLEREVAALVEGFPPAVKAEWRVIEGDPAATLADETAEGVDLLVIGSRAFGPVGRVFLGSVASRVVHSASCPVLVVPRRHAEAA